MGYTVNWSKFARVQLYETFEYFAVVAGVRKADQIVQNIEAATHILVNNPLAGQIELELTRYPQGFRYLVEGNYKILYFIAGNIVNISAVFDCRQNPAKMHNIK